MEFTAFRELDTHRLHLRKLRLEDAALFYERLAGDPDVTEHMLWKTHQNLSESIASIQKVLRRYEAGTCYRWAIARKVDDALIGIIDLLNFDETHNTCSFAYMLGRPFWGMGYGTEAVCAVFRFAFENLQVEAILADHFAENPASGAVMRKAGMGYQTTIPGKYEKNGQLHDAHVYRITKEEWGTDKRLQ